MGGKNPSRRAAGSLYTTAAQVPALTGLVRAECSLGNDSCSKSTIPIVESRGNSSGVIRRFAS